MKPSRLFLLTLLMTFAGVLGMNAQEPYCAVSYGNTSDGHSTKTVTFYYDTQRSSWDNTIEVNELDNLYFTDDMSIIFDNSFASYRPTACLKVVMMSPLNGRRLSTRVRSQPIKWAR